MTSRTTVLLVIGFLGVLALSIVLGSVYLVATHNQVPGELWTLAGTTTGALGSVLVSSRSGLGANEKEPTVLVPAPKIPDATSATVTVATTTGTGGDPTVEHEDDAADPTL